jgi:hypothetical protein
MFWEPGKLASGPTVICCLTTVMTCTLFATANIGLMIVLAFGVSAQAAEIKVLRK